MYSDLSPNGCDPPQPATLHGAHASSFLLDCNAWSNSCEHALITHSCLEPASRGRDAKASDGSAQHGSYSHSAVYWRAAGWSTG